MEIFLIQAFGLFYVFFGFGFLLNSPYYKEVFNSFMETKAMIIVAGILSFVLGSLFLYFGDFRGDTILILVEIVGLLGVIKGGLFIMAPQYMMRFYSRMAKDWINQTSGVLITVIGVVLISLPAWA